MLWSKDTTVLTSFSIVSGLLVVCLLTSPLTAMSQARPVNAAIDVSKAGAPISKYIYGQFLEHGGDMVNTGVWEWAYFGGNRDGYKVVPAYAWAIHEMFRHSEVFHLGAFTLATAMMSEKPTEAILNPTGMLFKMYRDHFGAIPVEVTDDSPQPKPTFPSGGDKPAINPDSHTYPLNVSAALSEDRKTLAIAVLNPSESEQSIKLAINGAKLVSAGRLWRMAPDSIDATVQRGEKPEVKIGEQPLGDLPETITVRRSSVNIYSYPVQ
jgi:alpha-N-arabinofuranosidase